VAEEELFTKTQGTLENLLTELNESYKARQKLSDEVDSRI